MAFSVFHQSSHCGTPRDLQYITCPFIPACDSAKQLQAKQSRELKCVGMLQVVCYLSSITPLGKGNPRHDVQRLLHREACTGASRDIHHIS